MEMYDLAVVGGGPGGYVAAVRAAQLGLKTVCIEQGKTLGGTCLNVGCIPSKALLQTTEQYAWLSHQAKEQGILFNELSIDFSKVMQRKEQIVQGLTQGIAGLFKRHGVTLIVGTAELIAPHSIAVSVEGKKQTIEAKHILLATGSEPTPLPFLPFDEKRILSSTGALSLPVVPKKMTVIGGGVIGVELASVYQRLGTEVTIVEMLPQICPTLEEPLSKALLQQLKKQGILFHLNAKVLEGKVNDKGVLLSVAVGEEKIALQSDVVLVAVGRRPYTRGLRLEEVGVSLVKGYVQVDGRFQTHVDSLYAIGDIIEGPMLAHRASEEGYAVAEMLAGLQGDLNYMAIPNVIYTHPEVATVGLTEQEAQGLAGGVRVGMASFRANPRARCYGEGEGFVKVVGIGKQGVLAGMHIIGPQASELINTGVLAIEKRATLREVALSPTAHPTLSEAIKEACLDAIQKR
jgi:dihydrolipoamide dehydrogenase